METEILEDVAVPVKEVEATPITKTNVEPAFFRPLIRLAPEEAKEEANIEQTEVVPEVESEEIPEETPEETLNKKNVSRFEYWQSEAQKSQAKLHDIEPYIPIAEYVKNNPQVLDIIEGSLKGQPQNALSTKEQAAETSLKKPESPKKPDSYNKFDAYNEPESESYKYRETLEEYRENLSLYAIQKQEFDEKQRDIAYQEYQRQQATQRQMSELYNTLQTKFQATAPDIEDFIKFTSQPITPELLWNYYMTVKNPSKAQNINKLKSDEIENRSSRLQIPLPGAIMPSKQELVTKDPNKLFHQMIFSKK